MTWKKAFPFVLSLLLLVGCATNTKNVGNKGAANKGTNVPFKIGMVTDTGGINDESFNQSAWNGITRAGKDLPADVKYLESKRSDDFIPNLTRFAREKRNIIWGIGFRLDKAIIEAANKFPDVNFGMVDSDLGGKVPKNAIAVTFREAEGSYLMGVLAGLSTKTNKIGFVGGVSSPLIKKFETGFVAGVKEVNPKATVQVAYAESFTDATKGRSLAANLYNGGADIIFHAAGGTGKGVFDEVKTREKGKFYVIGCDQDQARLAPDHTLSSLVKRVDLAVYDISKQVKDGNAPLGKVITLGLKENALSFPQSKLVKPEVTQKLEEYKQKIIKGEIKVPSK